MFGTPSTIGRTTLAAFAAALALGGCASTSTIDTAFSGIAPPAAPETAPAAAGPPSVALRDTGTYPNINLEPQARLEPLDAAEQAAVIADMEALAARHAAGRISTAADRERAARLRRLAASHSAETLARIEGR